MRLLTKVDNSFGMCQTTQHFPLPCIIQPSHRTAGLSERLATLMRRLCGQKISKALCTCQVKFA
jgi:hypothetical protein